MSILHDRIQYLRGKNKKQGKAPRVLYSGCAPWVLQESEKMFSDLVSLLQNDQLRPKTVISAQT
jgi:hypothetical protein